MSKLEQYSRRYAYKVRHKYRQDPFAFMVLWALFFSAIFLIFAFRGLIAVTFMREIDTGTSTSAPAVTEEIAADEGTTENAPASTTPLSDIQASGDTYTVKSGDSLYGIGLELGKDWKVIAELNGIGPPYSLGVGQVLKLP